MPPWQGMVAPGTTASGSVGQRSSVAASQINAIRPAGPIRSEQEKPPAATELKKTPGPASAGASGDDYLMKSADTNVRS